MFIRNLEFNALTTWEYDVETKQFEGRLSFEIPSILFVFPFVL